jgi:nitrate/nitrite-specific signal transduction histidine kinase
VLGFALGVRMEGLLDTDVPGDIAEHVVAVLSAALPVIARHVRAGRAAVVLETDGHEVRLTVSESGAGIPPDGRRSGLHNMAEQAQHLRGAPDLASPSEGGTVLMWHVPLSPE